MKPIIWRPFTQMLNFEAPEKVAKTYGATLELQSGREIIDAISSWWVTNHGHCQPEISAAIAHQSSTLDQVLFANFEHDQAESVIENLSPLLPPKLSRFFFSDNGSTAVEVALKMVGQYWQQSGAPARKRIIAFHNAYHGDTVGAMSVSAKSVFTQPYADLLFKIDRVEINDLEKFNATLDQFDGEIAAIIVEPMIQGAGGMITWSAEKLSQIVLAAQKKGILVIFDEVMTGFGRTGKMFALNHLSEGATPDIICLSKGLTGGTLPLALTVATDEIYRAFLSADKAKMLFHGHSFTGNALSCAAAVASLKLFGKHDYTERWLQIEKTHIKRSESLRTNPIVKDIRILGTMAAIELNDDDAGYMSDKTKQLFNFAMQRGCFLRPLGNVIYTLPPYCISQDQLNQVWNIFEEFLTTEL